MKSLYPVAQRGNRFQVFGLSLASLLLLASLQLIMGCSSTGGKSSVETSPPAPPPLTAEQIQLNLDSFDMVWTTIRDKHWDPTLGGADWQGIREELRPKVAAATTMGEARAPMYDLISRLEQSHFGIFPASVYQDAAGAVGSTAKEDEGLNRGGTTGMTVRVRAGQVLVTRVLADSPAAEAGVIPGWEVTTVRGDSLAPRIAKLAESMAGKSSQGLILSSAMNSRMTGQVGHHLGLGMLDGKQQPVELNLELVEARGTPTVLGNLPEVHVWHETRTLSGDIGYYGFNFFLNIMEVMPAYNQAMLEFMDSKGVIIDLRGNPGGLGAMAMGMSGWLIEGKGQRLGVMTLRTGDLKFVINPRPQSYQGPVAVLVDEVSASTSEIMAGGLKDLGRARLFGVTTAGAALPSVIDKLPNGDGFQYAIANYISEGGEQLEGQGVVPHVEIIADRAMLLEKGDPVLHAAVEWINNQ